MQNVEDKVVVITGGSSGLGTESFVKTDVTQLADVQTLVKHAVETHGRIDVLLNNAGVMPLSPLEMLRVDEWSQTIGPSQINGLTRKTTLKPGTTLRITQSNAGRK